MSDEHECTDCSCRIMSDPIERLCRYCRIIREERDRERVEIEVELYKGAG
jgi:hypothetical protein